MICRESQVKRKSDSQTVFINLGMTIFVTYHPTADHVTLYLQVVWKKWTPYYPKKKKTFYILKKVKLQA